MSVLDYHVKETFNYVVPDVRLDWDGSNNPIYKGYASPGTATSASKWTVVKYTYTGTNPTYIQTLRNIAWDNRTTAFS